MLLKSYYTVLHQYISIFAIVWFVVAPDFDCPVELSRSQSVPSKVFYVGKSDSFFMFSGGIYVYVRQIHEGAVKAMAAVFHLCSVVLSLSQPAMRNRPVLFGSLSFTLLRRIATLS